MGSTANMQIRTLDGWAGRKNFSCVLGMISSVHSKLPWSSQREMRHVPHKTKLQLRQRQIGVFSNSVLNFNYGEGFSFGQKNVFQVFQKSFNTECRKSTTSNEASFISGNVENNNANAGSKNRKMLKTGEAKFDQNSGSWKMSPI